MKTTLVKTSFWNDEKFNELNLNTKLVYFFLLTNPSKGIQNIYKVNRKVLAVCVGLSNDQVELGLKQLEQEGYIKQNDGYVALLKDHAEAKTGRFSEQAAERELAEIPLSVREFLLETYQYNTSAVPEHVDVYEEVDVKVKEEVSAFDIFWSSYPNKESKKESKQVWSQKKLDKHLPLILDFIEKAKHTDRWKKGFVKQPPSFLRKESWNDDLASYNGGITNKRGVIGII